MSKTIVRRLTPLECERLQGFPDNWTLLEPKQTMSQEEAEFFDVIRKHMWDIKPEFDEKTGKQKSPYKPINTPEKALKWYNKMISSDSHRYKAIGNSIAIPQWYWLFRKMQSELPDKATLGSLFDGIGGFPLAFEDIYGEGSARWASEIEEFPIAVTKARFVEG